MPRRDVDPAVTPPIRLVAADGLDADPAPPGTPGPPGPWLRPVDALEVAEDERAPVLDDVAWNELMRRYGRRVEVSLVGRGIPLERAKELAQDAWIRIIAQHRAGRLPRLDMPGIVVAQATFLARDDLRRRDRRAGLAGDDDAVARLAAAVTGPDLERRVAARDELRRVLAVVQRSHVSARNVFALLYGAEPRTPAEITGELGLSVQRVRQILCEVRKAIREDLEGGADAG